MRRFNSVITTALTILTLSGVPTLSASNSTEDNCLKFYDSFIKPVVLGRDAGTHHSVLMLQLEMIGVPPSAAYSIVYNVFVVHKNADESGVKEVFMNDCAGPAL